jgi:hypothetical protein
MKVVDRVVKLSRQAQGTMLLEELASKFEGLESQLPNQLIPSRAERICSCRRLAGGTASGPAGLGGAPGVTSGAGAGSTSAMVGFHSKQEILS